MAEALRDPKLSIFQVVKFQNSACTGSSRNGTCFTAAECSELGGSEDQTCADGFGVCCIVTLATGQTSSVNNTYIVATAMTSGDHQFKICPCSDDICRIKFDFTTFTLNGPATANTLGKNSPTALLLIGQTGDCTEDQFSITGAIGSGTPIICGTNTGDHMIVDSNGSDCTIVNSHVGAGTTTTRNIEILVTQYRCGDENGGPPNCLQWYTTTSGRVRSFNFPQVTSGTNIASSATHLSNQDYQICIRRSEGMEYICYIPCTDTEGTVIGTAATAVTVQQSFGLSVSTVAILSNAMTASNCGTDYITIPGGNTLAIASSSIAATATTFEVAGRYCGRELGSQAGVMAEGISVCTNVTPFKVGVNFDENEVCSAIDDAMTCEFEMGPGGIVGFSLCYTQASQ